MSAIKLIVFLVMYITLYASSKTHINSDASVMRIKNYNNFIELHQSYSKMQQLIMVNQYLNKLNFQTDAINHNKSDYWATPEEFLSKGYGDCEDYVIIKYFSLLKFGFDIDKLFVTIVKDKYTQRDHMVLSYFNDSNSAPLILDNLSNEVLNLAQRKDLDIKAFINQEGVYKLKNDKLIKTTLTSKKFKELLKRV